MNVATYTKFAREWEGATAFLIVGGPSVREQNVELLRGRYVMVVNSSYQLAPWADFLFFADSRWYRAHQDRLKFFKGRIVTTSAIFSDRRLLKVRPVPSKALVTDKPDAVAFRHTSSQGAMNVLVHLGVKRIVLLGLDMAKAADGTTHHHVPHDWPQRATCWDTQKVHLAKMAAPLAALGIQVINTSLVSRVDWWPKRSLADVINEEGDLP